MSLTRLLCSLLTVAATLGLANAQSGYPTRPITIVVPYAEGGPTDKVARPIAAEMSKQLGQPVLLKFQGGDGATRAPRELVREGSDGGYTLLLHNIGMASAPTLYRQLRFDPQKDYEPIGLVADAPMLILGKRDLPPLDAKQLWPYIRQNEATIAVAYGGPGGAGHLCGLMLEAALNVRLIWIPYTGTGPALNDLQRGRADLLCDQTTHATKALEAGVVKAYALTAERRLEILPQVPTATEAGVGTVKIVVWHGLYAVRGTPPEVIDQLSNALQLAVASPAFVAAMSQVGVIAATAQQATPPQLRAHLAKEIARWRPLIVRTGQYAD